MSLLLSIRDVCLQMGEKNQILSHISFDITKGESLAIIGRSGSGKTMLAKVLSDLMTIENSSLTGNVYVHTFNKSYDLLHTDAKTRMEHRRRVVSYIFQDPFTAFNPSRRLGKQLDEALQMAKADRNKDERRNEILDLLAQMEFDDTERIYSVFPHELSGGQLQRVMIAMAVLKEPELLILDEPTASLDQGTSTHILSLLTRLKDRFGFAMLFISHDLGLIKTNADRYLQMKSGVLQEVSEGAFYQCPEKKQLAISTGKITVLDFLNVSHEYSFSKTFFGPKKVQTTLDSVSFQIYQGERVGLMGVSGSGKSTIAKLITHIEKPTSGMIRFKDKSLADWRRTQFNEFKKSVQLIFQHPFASLNPRQQVLDCLREVTMLHNRGERDLEARALELLTLVSLPESYRHRYPWQLSGGEQQRVAIARALAVEPELLICDECVSSLDPEIKYEILDLLMAIQTDQSLSILFVSHDLQVIEYVCTRVLMLRDGRVYNHSKSL